MRKPYNFEHSNASPRRTASHQKYDSFHVPIRVPLKQRLRSFESGTTMLHRGIINCTPFERCMFRVFYEVALNLWTRITHLRDRFVLWTSGISANSDQCPFVSTWRPNGTRPTNPGPVSSTAGLPLSFDRKWNSLTRNVVTFETPKSVGRTLIMLKCTQNQPTQSLIISQKQ